MRNALFVLALVLLAAPACRQHRYFVDLDRAVNETDAGKKAAAERRRELESKQREVGQVEAAAKAAEDAKAADAPAKRAHATDTGKKLQREFELYSQAVQTNLLAGVRTALARLAFDRRVDVIEQAAPMAWVDPEYDVTDAAIRYVNAAAKASEIEALKAENQRLKAKGK